MTDDTELVVELATPARRRRTLVWVAVMLVVFGYLLVQGDTTSRFIVAALAVFGAIVVLRDFERLHVSDDGLTFDRRVLRQHLAWEDLSRIRIDWGTVGRSGAQLPVIERRDGRDVRRRDVLAPLAARDRTTERQALEAHLIELGARHDVPVQIVQADT